MNKIYEHMDLSKIVLDIDIDSEVFNALRSDLNKEVQRCIKEVFNEEFESGEITLKLNIEIPTGVETIPKKNEFDEMVNETFTYKKPKFEHKITTTLKKQYKQEGVFTEKRDIQLIGGVYVAVPIKEAQMNIDDLQN